MPLSHKPRAAAGRFARATSRGMSVWAAMMIAACPSEQPAPLCLSPVALASSALIAADRIAVGLVDGYIRVRGFSGAVPADSTLRVQLAHNQYSLQADRRGRFSGSWSSNHENRVNETENAQLVVQLQVEGHDDVISFRVRSDAAATCSVDAPMATGTTPNDVAIHSCGGKAVAFVVHSSDGTVAAYHPVDEMPSRAISFAVDEFQRGANPWSIAFDGDGGSAAVTLFGQQAIAWIDPCAGRIQQVLTATQGDGTPLWLDVEPPVDVDLALDVDGDGETETHIERMLARTPQGIAFAQGKWLVTFTNLLQVGAKPIYGPGLLVAFDAHNGKFKPAGHRILPCTNPQSITVDNEGFPWVSCTGVLGPGPDGFEALSEGHLLRISADTLDVEESISMGRFAPGTPGFYDRFIVVGSLVRPRVTLLERGATTIEDGHEIRLDESERVESIFEVAPYVGGLVLLAEYGQDRLHVLDVETRELNPWPFETGIAVGPGGMAFHGVQSLAIDTQLGSVPSAYAVLAQSHELVPLHLWQVMGP